MRLGMIGFRQISPTSPGMGDLCLVEASRIKAMTQTREGVRIDLEDGTWYLTGEWLGDLQLAYDRLIRRSLGQEPVDSGGAL